MRFKLYGIREGEVENIIRIHSNTLRDIVVIQKDPKLGGVNFDYDYYIASTISLPEDSAYIEIPTNQLKKFSDAYNLKYRSVKEGFFVTENENILNSKFLPTELVDQGEGLFWEDRLSDSLFKLNLIPQDSQIIQIKDLGGWDSMHKLTASLSVIFRLNDTEYSSILDAEAIVSVSSAVMPIYLSAVKNRNGLLRLYGLKTNLLEAKDGVIYTYRQPFTLEAFMENKLFSNLQNVIMDNILCELAKIKNLIILGYFNVDKAPFKHQIIDQIVLIGDLTFPIATDKLQKNISINHNDVVFSNLKLSLAQYDKKDIILFDKFLKAELPENLYSLYNHHDRDWLKKLSNANDISDMFM